MVAKVTMSTFEFLCRGTDLEVKAGPMNPSAIPTRSEDAMNDPVLVFMLAEFLLVLLLLLLQLSAGKRAPSRQCLNDFGTELDTGFDLSFR